MQCVLFFFCSRNKNGLCNNVTQSANMLIYWVFALYRKSDCLLARKSFCEAVGLAEACIDSNTAFRVDLLALIVNDFEPLSGDIDLGNA